MHLYPCRCPPSDMRLSTSSLIPGTPLRRVLRVLLPQERRLRALRPIGHVFVRGAHSSAADFDHYCDCGQLFLRQQLQQGRAGHHQRRGGGCRRDDTERCGFAVEVFQGCESGWNSNESEDTYLAVPDHFFLPDGSQFRFSHCDGKSISSVQFCQHRRIPSDFGGLCNVQQD